jgi:hypothetical protein
VCTACAMRWCPSAGPSPFARVAGKVSGSGFGGAFKVEPRVQTGDGQHTSDLPRDGHQLQPTSGLLVAAGGSAEHVQSSRSQEVDTGAVHTDVPVSGGQEIGQQLLEARCGEAVQLTGEQNTSVGDIADQSQHEAIRRSRLPAVDLRLWCVHAPIPTLKAKTAHGRVRPRTLRLLVQPALRIRALPCGSTSSLGASA